MPPPGGDVAGEVAAISTAVGQLADGLATMLTTIARRADNTVTRLFRTASEPEFTQAAAA